jgi:hypothetical protein
VDLDLTVATPPSSAAPAGRPALVRATLALAGAWLPIVFSSAVLLPQRVEAIVAVPAWSATYAAVSAAGWTAVVLGLTLSGHLRDAGRLEGPGDRWTLRLLAFAVLVTGSLLPLADTVATLAVLWVAALLPAAFGVTLLAARAADCGASTVASASAIGSAPLLAVFIGALAVTAAPLTGPARFVLVALLAAAGIVSASGARTPSAIDPTAPPLPVVTDPAVRDAIRRHRRLLASVTCVDTGTVALTFAIVPIVFLLPRDTVAQPGTYAELLVLVATVLSLLAAWTAPRITRTRERPRALFVLSALLTAAALVAAPLVGADGLLLVAVAAGIAVGASNAATFALFLADPASRQQRATGLGLLNAVSSVPAALIPLVAVPLLRWSPSDGLLALMVVAAVAATIGAVSVPRATPAERSATG